MLPSSDLFTVDGFPFWLIDTPIEAFIGSDTNGLKVNEIKIALRKADEKALLRELGLALHIFFRKGSKPIWVRELSESDRVTQAC